MSDFTGATSAVRTADGAVRDGSSEGSSTGELVASASAQLTDLVRSEMRLARADVQQSVKRAGTGAGLFGAAGIMALYGGGALIATAILALALVVDAWLAALIVTVVLFVIAGIAALVGKKQVAQVTPPIQNSVDSVKRDVQSVTDRGQS